MRSPAQATHLPPPHPDAAALSRDLVARISARIASAGPLRFDEFQQMALYEPSVGYYSGPLHKFGAAGDFVTAPEISPLFGATLARFVSPALAASQPQVLELGPGAGTLAAQMAGGLPGVHYRLLELSATLSARQRETILSANVTGRCEWLTALPDRISGVVIANEVLDAVPTRLFKRDAGGLYERHVTTHADGALAFYDVAIAPDSPEQATIAERFPTGNAPYLSEWNPQAEALVASIAERLDSAIAVFIDYGFAAHEFYHASRHMGTLMCHYRHHAHPDALYLPGLQDITSHVDFSAMARAAANAGAEVALFTTQAHFLLGAGLLDGLAALTPGTLPYIEATTHLQRLVSPAEMGELFKVLVIGKGAAMEAASLIPMRVLPL